MLARRRARRRGRAGPHRYPAASCERGRLLALLPSTPAADLGEIAAALERYGLRPSRVDELAPPDPSKRGRAAYRIELDDGRTVKARRLESAAAARRLHELRRGIEPAFAPVIGCAGRVLLEEWIAGAPLAEPDAWVEPAAVLLARLHATPIAATPQRVGTGRWRAEAARDLAHLEAEGLLAPAERGRLAALLDAGDPGSAPLVLAHRDFCADNMVVDAAGALRVVDNEWIEPQPAGIDLARTAVRWPMAPAAWRRFLDAYRAAAPADPGPLAFWEVPALAWTIRVRLRRGREHAASALVRLRALEAPPP